MSKNKNTKKALEKLQAKRAQFAAGGYGRAGRRTTGGYAPKTLPEPKPKTIPKPKPKTSAPIVPETVKGGGNYKPGSGFTDGVDPSLYSDPDMGGGGRRDNNPSGNGPRGGTKAPDTRVVGDDGRTYFNQAEADKANVRYAKKQKDPNPIKDAVMGERNRASGGYGGTGYGGTPPPQTEGQEPDPTYLDQQDPASRGSVSLPDQEIGNPDDPLYGTPYPTPTNPANPGPMERQAIEAWNAANTGGTGGGPPIGIEIEGPQANLRQMESVDIDPETGISTEIEELAKAKDATTSTVVSGDMRTARGYARTADLELGDGTAESYEAATAGKLDPTKAAQGKVSEVGVSTDATAATVDTAQRDPDAEEAAMGTAVDRPPEQDYAKAALEDERFEIIQAQDPEVAARMAQTMSEREQKDLLDIVSKEGVNLEDIPEFTLAKERVAQVGEAKSRIASEIGNVPPVDMQERQGITGTAPQGDAAQIGGVPTAQAASMNAVTGPARMVAAADMLAVVANVPKAVTAAIVDDPAKVNVARDDGADPQTIAAIAALPVEALVSTQMEGLLAGMEDGETPAWARPAVAAIEAKMAQRGLSTSTVGRDALFNAIIQSALPIAQSNAQALQQRASQNLSNEQQANMSTAQNTMQIRMQNLANEQTSASQTASMANEITKQKNSFEQQAVMTTAQQQQETELTNAQMAQQKSQQESAQKQQAAVSTLSAGVQSDLANLQAMNAAGSQNMTADQQSKLATYNAQVAKVMRQADLDQDMEKANISNELQVELKNLTEVNATDRASMSAVNQGRLADLNVLVDFKKTNASLSQQMDLANLNNDQQMELANLSERAATDSANMTEANRMKLQELTIYTTMMAKNEDLRQGAEMAQLSASEKVQLANLTFENQADSESMNAENVAQLQMFEKKMAAGQVNAQLAQAMGLANLSNEQSAGMFNAQMNANFDMSKMSNEQQMEMANSKFMQTMTSTQFSADQQSAMQNATALTQVDLANADARTRVSVENAKNFLTMDMANLSNEQQGVILDQQVAQQSLLSDQSAENARRQFGATSQNQLDQFLIGQSNAMSQYNTSAQNAMESFNVGESNRMAAIGAGNDLQASQANAQIEADLSKFNASIDNQRDQWNASNAQAVEQSNIQWRRQANTANTAATNAANQVNVQNAYNISALDQTQMWQTLRDEAAYVRQSYENNEQREAQLLATAIGNESATGSKNIGTSTSALIDILGRYGYKSGAAAVIDYRGGR